MLQDASLKYKTSIFVAFATEFFFSFLLFGVLVKDLLVHHHADDYSDNHDSELELIFHDVPLVPYYSSLEQFTTMELNIGIEPMLLRYECKVMPLYEFSTIFTCDQQDLHLHALAGNRF